jgi:uncharacterized protein YecT (DUF1311 family)
MFNLKIMKIKSLVKVFNVIVIFSLAILLNNKAYSQSKKDCSNATTQSEINVCSQNQYAAADKELNDLYKKVSAKLDTQQKTTLIQSQRKWISFRDEYAKIYEMIYKGGSMAPSAVLKCKTDLTRTRIAELQTLFDQVNL